MKYKVDNNKILLSIDKGEFVNQTILQICKKEQLPFGWVSGIGAIVDAEVGYFDVKKKDYVKKFFKGDFELTSLIGNITMKENDLFVHTHITFTNTDFKAFGGHLFDCKIAAAGEFIILVGKEKNMQNIQ